MPTFYVMSHLLIAIGYLMQSHRRTSIYVYVQIMSMSGNFLEFVHAYRCQDSDSIKSGYLLFAPRWKVLGQLKYLEAYLEQLDCLLQNNQYSRLEEVRRNRCVRTYHGRTNSWLWPTMNG